MAGHASAPVHRSESTPSDDDGQPDPHAASNSRARAARCASAPNPTPNVYSQLQRRRADQGVYAVALALEYALQLFPIHWGDLRRMLPRTNHVEPAIEHDQVIVVRTL